MILFTILAIVAVIAAIIALAVVGTIGAGVVVVFGDIIIFGLILWAIVKLFRRKK